MQRPSKPSDVGSNPTAGAREDELIRCQACLLSSALFTECGSSPSSSAILLKPVSLPSIPLT